METTIMGYIGVILGYILGLYWDNGKENGNYYLGSLCTQMPFFWNFHAKFRPCRWDRSRPACDVGVIAMQH